MENLTPEMTVEEQSVLEAIAHNNPKLRKSIWDMKKNMFANNSFAYLVGAAMVSEDVEGIQKKHQEYAEAWIKDYAKKNSAWWRDILTLIKVGMPLNEHQFKEALSFLAMLLVDVDLFAEYCPAVGYTVHSCDLNYEGKCIEFLENIKTIGMIEAVKLLEDDMLNKILLDPIAILNLRAAIIV